MTYDRQILRILTAVGEKGISVQLLAKHVYNQNSTLFYTPDLSEIRSYVQQYLLKNSKLPSSLIESMEQRGYYRLNTKNNPPKKKKRKNLSKTYLWISLAEKPMISGFGLHDIRLAVAQPSVSKKRVWLFEYQFLPAPCIAYHLPPAAASSLQSHQHFLD